MWDFLLNLTRGNQAGALESLDWLIPRVDNLQDPGFWLFALGDASRALELYLSTEPGWLNPDQWDELLNQHNVAGCIVGWIMKDTGDEELGRQLIEKTTQFMEVTLPAAVEHVDNWDPSWCYLAAGNTESAYQSLETVLAHGHRLAPSWWFSLPVYDAIRMEPRFLSIAEEVERRHKEQRLAVEALLVEAGL